MCVADAIWKAWLLVVTSVTGVTYRCRAEGQPPLRGESARITARRKRAEEE